MFRRPTRLQSAFAVLATLVVAATFVISTNATADPADGRASDPANAGEDASTTSGPALTAHGPDHVEVGPFTVELSTDEIADASAYEAVVRHAGSLTLTNATTEDGARVLRVPQTDGTAIAVIPCGGADCDPSPELTLTFMPSGPGAYAVDLVSTLVVDAEGTSLDHVAGRTDVVVADGAVARASIREFWDTDRTTEAAAEADVTGDGRISSVDVTEGVIAWTSSRAAGDPCALDSIAAVADLNEDGCADISDLQALTTAADRAAISGGVGDTGSTDAGTDGDRDADVDYQGILAGARAPEAAGTGQALGSVAAPAQVETTLVVTALNDGADTQLGDNVCISNEGGCSLRAAILQANATPGPGRIEFDIPGTGPHTIQLTKRLPTISDTTGGLTIDGYTQPGSSVNTDPTASNAQIRVQIRGLGGNDEASGAAMVISSANNVVRGLSIFDAFYGIQVVDTAAIGNRILGNFIGTDAAGTFGWSNGFTLGAGIWLYDGPKNTVVGTPALEDRNVISGNRTVGVKVEQSRTTDNIVQNNIVGMSPSATTGLGNNAGFDLQWHSKRTIIGGTGVNEGNLISGNAYTAIDLSHTTQHNQVLGNLIGTDATGTGATAVTGNGDGILIKDNPFGNVIAHNIISGNDNNGIWGKHNYTDSNTIRDNLIGIGADGSALPNRDWGIWLTGESDLITGNVIAHNDDGGIYVNDSNGNHDNYPAERTRENRITANSFFGNGGLAIDIEPVGVNANDAGDSDSGAHDRLNFPEVATLTAGHIDGSACADCTVEIYVADAGTDTHGEGRQLVATTVADSAGDFTLDDAAIVLDRTYTLLAIDPAGNTSEFGPRVGETGGAGASITPTLLEGAFFYETIAGEEFAITHGYNRNDGGADATSSKVHFTFDVATAGTYNVVGRIYAPDGSSDSFWAQMDGQPAPDGIYWDTPSDGLDDFPITSGGNVVDFVLDAGSHTLTLSRREDDIGIASIRLVPVGGASNTAPVITDPGAQSSAFDETVALALAVTDADADALTFFATGLPSGLVIDQASGAISGVTDGDGVYSVVVHAFDGTDTASLTIPWTVAPPNRGPEFTDPGPQSPMQGSVVDLPILAVDPDDDPITFSAQDLPTGLSIEPTTGVISGVVEAAPGTYPSEITATDGPHPTTLPLFWTVTPAPYECTVDGPTFTVSWTDQGADKYYVRHQLDGSDDYLGTTTGLEFPALDLDGTYVIRHKVDGVNVDTTCDGPGNPVFECTVDGATNTVSWTDMGASTYYIRHAVNGNDNYIGSTTELTYPALDLDGTYLVRYKLNNANIDTTCDGPGNPPFECSIDELTSTLSWDDQGASTYYIRHVVDGTDSYVGSTSELSYLLTDLTGTYVVKHYLGGTFQTSCTLT